MSEPLREIGIDNRIESYDGYLPDEWTGQVHDVSKGQPRSTRWSWTFLGVAHDGLHCHDARDGDQSDAGRNARLRQVRHARWQYPLLLRCRSRQGVAEGSRISRESGSSRSLDERTRNCRSRVPRKRSAVTPEMPIEPLWQAFLGQDAFRLSVWASQRVAYVASTTHLRRSWWARSRRWASPSCAGRKSSFWMPCVTPSALT